jgi:hypothetical protein
MTSRPACWLPDQPEQIPAQRLIPDPERSAILGWHDGPILFTGTIDGRAVIASLYAAEIEETHETQFYCAAPITPEILAALKAGTEPLISVFEREPGWVICERTDETGTTHRSWSGVIPPSRILASPDYRLRPLAEATPSEPVSDL